MKAFGDDKLVNAVLDDHLSADIEPGLKATLTFLQKLTLQPWDITSQDIEPMRKAGLSDEAVAEAIGVCVCFSIIDRIADAFDFPISDARHLRVIEQMLLKVGYGVASVPG